MSTRAAPEGTEAPAPGFFQCGSCKRQYKRLDHLARHVRSHTHFKPHKCPFCSRAFARTDLLKRHVAGHEAQGEKTKSGPRPQRGTQDAPGRVTQACKTCAANHIRCTESKPCRRCQNKGIDCVWNLTGVVSSEAPTADDDDTAGQRPQAPPKSIEMESSNLLNDISVQVSSPPQTMSLDASQPENQVSRDEETATMVTPQIPYQQPFLGYSSESKPEGLTGFSTPRLPDWNFLPGQLPSQSGQDFDLNMPDFALDDIDMRLMDLYNASVPFELGGGSQTDISEPREQLGAAGVPSSASTASEAFRKYHWRFRPNTRDRAGAEEHNLSLPSGSPDAATPESRVRLSKRVAAPTLSVASRDSILTIVVKGCRPENLSRAVASFPSVELLDRLLQFYLTTPIAHAGDFIHAASFDPNNRRPELLLSMIAAGAVLTADPTLTKLGYALQESVRPAVSSQWESNNALVRDLELLQAFLIYLEIGIWSGHGRKIEITESFLQPPLTMIRRAGKLKKTAYTNVVVQAGDHGSSLRAAWEHWVCQETFKRLAFRLLCHDTNSSMCLSVNPLISYAEVSLPLPCPPNLWTASSPDTWKELYLSQEQGQPPTVTDYLAEPSTLGCRTNNIPFDVGIAHKAFLSCAWSLSWEYIQLHSLHAINPGQWNALILSSRQEEILRLLNRFRISMDTCTPFINSDIMRLELILLHLHVPFEDIQIFVGMEGPDPARVAQAAVVEWSKGEAARKAVWHAGQIIRLAKDMPRGTIRGPEAFFTYHAALVLWVYGLLSSGQGSSRVTMSTPSRRDPDPIVWLDDGDSLELQKFTQLGMGRPCFRGVVSDEGVSSEVPLAEPDKVMAAMVLILRASYEGQPNPHVVDRLIQLMEALQYSSDALFEFHQQF